MLRRGVTSDSSLDRCQVWATPPSLSALLVQASEAAVWDAGLFGHEPAFLRAHVLCYHLGIITEMKKWQIGFLVLLLLSALR